MPWRCCVPRCKGYDEARSMGVVLHGLPTRDPQRCRAWLNAIRSPRLDEHTPVSRYGGVRVCSLHFQPEDYEEDFRARILNVAPRPVLKSAAVPSVFPRAAASGEPGGADASPSAPKRSRTQHPQANTGAPVSSSRPDESFCIVVSVDESDKDCALVRGRSLMELFRRCQSCGQPIRDAQLLPSGARVRVAWSCQGGHSGVWKSSHSLKDIHP